MIDISHGKEKIPVLLNTHCSNGIILEPPVFTYSRTNILPPAYQEWEKTSFYQGCTCKDSCENQKCECRLSKLETAGDTSVFECHPSCSCIKERCTNNIMQQGVFIHLEVFYHKKKGWSVKAAEYISKGTFVCEYAGEVVTTKDAKLRWSKYQEQKLPNYIFCLRENIGDSKIFRTNVDPTVIGNVARFINHSCDPNLSVTVFRVRSPIPRIALIANRDIPLGQELTFSYGNCSLNGLQLIESQKPCACGAANCKGILPYDCTL